jgi:type IV secretory pathway VirJ component
LTSWQKSSAILIGYSQGADVLPFMVNRLPSSLLAKINLIALLGLEKSADFEFHIMDWLGESVAKTALPVEPEIEKLTGIATLCLFGEEDKSSLCPTLRQPNLKVISLKGGHHFDGDYKKIADIILQEVQ